MEQGKIERLSRRARMIRAAIVIVVVSIVAYVSRGASMNIAAAACLLTLLLMCFVGTYVAIRYEYRVQQAETWLPEGH